MKRAPGGTASTPSPTHLRFRAGVILLAVLLVASVIVASGAGAVHVPSHEIVAMLLNRMGLVHFNTTWPQSDETIILQIRLPRVLAAGWWERRSPWREFCFRDFFAIPWRTPT